MRSTGLLIFDLAWPQLILQVPRVTSVDSTFPRELRMILKPFHEPRDSSDSKWSLMSWSDSEAIREAKWFRDSLSHTTHVYSEILMILSDSLNALDPSKLPKNHGVLTHDLVWPIEKQWPSFTIYSTYFDPCLRHGNSRNDTYYWNNESITQKEKKGRDIRRTNAKEKYVKRRR